MSLPKPLSDQARCATVASLAFAWKGSAKVFPLGASVERGFSKELMRLQSENQALRTQIETLYEWFLCEGKIHEQVELLKGISLGANESSFNSFFQRRAKHLRARLQDQLLAFPTQVIYRDPSSWSSSLWIDAGEEDNQAIGHAVISKNSPVVVGSSLIGVIDYVGKKQSRVRLITDSGLSPAVRAVRGASQNRELAQSVHTLIQRLDLREDLFASSQEKEQIHQWLKGLQTKLGMNGEEGYLAKGELRGSSAPFWRSRGLTLKGIGFNFDYPDEEGPARELRTGRPVGATGPSVPILKEGDLLVTSGLDGVFPPGLFVATVSWVSPIKEGSYAYEIEAKPTATHLHDLQTLFVLPALRSE